MHDRVGGGGDIGSNNVMFDFCRPQILGSPAQDFLVLAAIRKHGPHTFQTFPDAPYCGNLF